MLVLAALCAFAATSSRAAGQPRVREYTQPIVLVVRPDSAQVEQLRRRLGDEAFYVTADDASFYQARTFELLDSLRVPYEAIVAAKLRFRVGGVMKAYTLRDSDVSWFVLIYDGVSEPKVSSGVDDLAEEVRRLAPGKRRGSVADGGGRSGRDATLPRLPCGCRSGPVAAVVRSFGPAKLTVDTG